MLDRIDIVNLKLNMLCVLCISIFLRLTIVIAEEACHDIDPKACERMQDQNPNFCSDPILSNVACPKFCKNCPITCYHCNATVQDYHFCASTLTCPKGYACMRKELRSLVDGHREYEMTCARKQDCDDPWNSMTVFGKRHLESRDVSITCCTEDLCNYPVQTTLPPPTMSTVQPLPTDCIRDLVFIVDESSSLVGAQSSIMHFIWSIVYNLPVSTSDVHVSLGLFASEARSIFHLNQTTSSSSIWNAINGVKFLGGEGEINKGLHHVINSALTPGSGDRPTAPNVVIVITDDGTRNGSALVSLEKEIHKKASVITIELGTIRFSSLASDTDHQFRIIDAHDLRNNVDRVLKLIC